ncbi:hypothetical protein F2Q68_00027594 [Brassica cretica]|uniref:Uncharacterized protein n=1 Tax=Brassica cretica TaxID=69181 RepID=A0A8S9IB12_BRACR|nr:hypothetical protein F2Q68_00027594 [Brassica cretica]
MAGSNDLVHASVLRREFDRASPKWFLAGIDGSAWLTPRSSAGGGCRQNKAQVNTEESQNRMRRREQVTYQLRAGSFGTGIEALKENNTP